MQLIIVRHGETEWTISGQHTGVSEIELTAHGREQASALRGLLATVLASKTPIVYTSPRRRAVETMQLALANGSATVSPLLAEWDYGAYEAKTTGEILTERPNWDIWRDGCPGGESPLQVAARADRFLHEYVNGVDAPVVVFSHGHFSRVLTARAVQVEPRYGALFAIDPASVSTVIDHQQRPCVGLWNATAELLLAEHGTD